MKHLIYFLTCRPLGEWIPSIVNQLYWSIKTSKTANDLVERFLSTIHNCCNRHTFPGNRTYKKCEHKIYTKEESSKRNWLVFGSPSHEALKGVLLNKQLVKDLEKPEENLFTTHLEVFHALKIRYLFVIFYKVWLPT